MKRFASHRLYIPHLGLFLKNYVVQLDEQTGAVTDYYPFTEEISFTEWLNGLIVLSYDSPKISLYGTQEQMSGLTVLFVDNDKKLRSLLPSEDDNKLLTLNAYYVTSFNVSDMCFSDNSIVVRLS